MKQAPELRRGFVALTKWPRASAAVCEAAANASWASSMAISQICSASHLPLVRQGDVDALLTAGAEHGLFRRDSATNWTPVADRQTLYSLSMMLEGATVYIESVHKEVDEVDVVLTKPLRPSALEAALIETGFEHIGVVATGEIFSAMAHVARTRFTVMTPFLDLAGGAALVSLYNNVSEAKRQLILRSGANGIPEGYLTVADALRRLGVEVYDYRLEREGTGFETFHAKVVMADTAWAYVGSTNMNQWSLAYSMELGVSLKGRAARRVARVVDAVMKVAKRLH
jgi:hypothetical protein